MRFTTKSVLSLLLVAGSASAKSFHHMAIHKRSSGTFVGCFSSAGSLGGSTTYTYQSTGWCSDHCTSKSASYFATTNGKDCLCGSSAPDSSDKVDTSKCDTQCAGYPENKCGGDGFYSVYSFDTGNDDGSSTSATTTTGDSSPTKTDAAVESVSTNAGGHTVIITTTPTSAASSDDSGSKGGGTNTAAIAAGVVVGVVGVAALAGGGFFFYRSRKQKAEGGAGAGFSGSTHQQMSDSRFDGSYMAERRQSNGSIDDDHDFSRRILQVTNPDHR
ncbi:hypothetical protein N7509_006836 [Penicillium cosmopolitanum]|uniref:WSC domain-containing protein n=1 Tax=Penicillium cosmopolitanum TaxID=1131564 RepID=A0A9W9VY07_9EURO|nr:uncharacterized protein N7509_006836 [Penicillium cosmopolitanum]KAJ5391346.1 hypothetical protein N7509_006836 [Penicillium cosmopolitanum]